MGGEWWHGVTMFGRMVCTSRRPAAAPAGWALLPHAVAVTHPATAVGTLLTRAAAGWQLAVRPHRQGAPRHGGSLALRKVWVEAVGAMPVWTRAWSRRPGIAVVGAAVAISGSISGRRSGSAIPAAGHSAQHESVWRALKLSASARVDG